MYLQVMHKQHHGYALRQQPSLTLGKHDRHSASASAAGAAPGPRSQLCPAPAIQKQQNPVCCAQSAALNVLFDLIPSFTPLNTFLLPLTPSEYLRSL